MAGGDDWMPTREQIFAELCREWKIELGKPENVSAFGWKQAEAHTSIIRQLTIRFWDSAAKKRKTCRASRAIDSSCKPLPFMGLLMKKDASHFVRAQKNKQEG